MTAAGATTAADTLAFAGAGMIAAVHGLAAQSLPGVRVLAVASRTRRRAAARADELGASVCTYEDLPAGAGAVVVASPPACHAEHAHLALRAGAGALIEKPLCATLAQADDLVALDPDGTAIGYAENLAFAPAATTMLDLVPELGPLHHLTARALQPRPTWGGFLERAWGGGVLFDLGAHPLALVLLAARPAEPVRVSASLEAGPDAAGHELVVDDWARVELTFTSGLMAVVEASWRHPTAEWDLQAASADGVVRLELAPSVHLERNGEALTTPAPPADAAAPAVHTFGYVEQLRAYLDARRAGRPLRLGARFGRAVLDVVCGAYASAAAGGSAVALPFAGRRDRTPIELWRP